MALDINQLSRERSRITSDKFSLSVAPHGAFGALATLELSGQPRRRLTLQEASIVADAIEAVAVGASPERRIYMSPIASDQDLDARVTEGGLIVSCEASPELFLSWLEAAELAGALKRASLAE